MKIEEEQTEEERKENNKYRNEERRESNKYRNEGKKRLYGIRNIEKFAEGIKRIVKKEGLSVFRKGGTRLEEEVKIKGGKMHKNAGIWEEEIKRKEC